jgi:hypothetical protein
LVFNKVSEVGDTLSENSFFEIHFTVSNEESRHNRKYEKFSTVLSKIVAIINFLIWIGFAFVRPLSEMDYLLKMACLIFNLSKKSDNNSNTHKKGHCAIGLSLLDKVLFTFFKKGRRKVDIELSIINFKKMIDFEYIVSSLMNLERLSQQPILPTGIKTNPEPFFRSAPHCTDHRKHDLKISNPLAIRGDFKSSFTPLENQKYFQFTKYSKENALENSGGKAFENSSDFIEEEKSIRTPAGNSFLSISKRDF